MHVINKPYLKRMSEVIPNLRWEKRAPSFDENLPDGGIAERLSLIFPKRKTPTAQAGILPVLFKYRRFDRLGHLALGV